MKKAKQILSVLLAVLMIALSVPLAGAASEPKEITASGTCGSNLTWTLDSEGTLTVSGEGSMYDYYSYSDIGGGRTTAPWGEHIQTIKTVVIGNSVTSIGKGAFASCSNVTDVTISDSVTNIGYRAFFECSSVTDVTFPDSVTYIDSCAFQYCSNLTEVMIPGNVKSIGDYAFEHCSSLTCITVDPNNANYASDDNGCLYSKDFSTLIQYPIGNPSTTFTIPNGVTSIGRAAFLGCSSLTNITIPNSVTSIGWSAFLGCSSLTNITIPNSVTSIDLSTFSACSSLINITIPNSITSIGIFAFEYCSSLTDVYYTGSETQWNQISIDAYNDPLLNATIHFMSQPTTDQTTQPTTQPDNFDNAPRQNIFQRIIQWIRDFFARLFGRI